VVDQLKAFLKFLRLNRNVSPHTVRAYEGDLGQLLDHAAAVSGASILNLHGGIHVELTYHPAQSIIDDDIAGMLGRFVQGIEVNQDTLALDVIHEVGPIPGHYLRNKHTLTSWKKEHFLPAVSDRLSYHDWIKQGKKTILENAKEKMGTMLAAYEADPPLTESQNADLDRILEEARAYYAKKGLL
jgi:trimethylamine--corrinoid protein Co-methyltransferase